MFLTFSSSLFSSWKVATTANASKNQERVFFHEAWQSFLVAHILVLHTNLHYKVCLTLLPLTSVKKLPHILAGTAPSPILLIIWNKIHILLYLVQNFLPPFLQNLCLEAWRPCRVLIYDIPLTVTAINYNVKVQRMVLLQLTNSPCEKRYCQISLKVRDESWEMAWR